LGQLGIFVFQSGNAMKFWEPSFASSHTFLLANEGVKKVANSYQPNPHV